MKNHHKLGIAITCTFLCLCGAVIGLKLQDAQVGDKPNTSVAEKQESAKNDSVNPGEPSPSEKGRSPSTPPAFTSNNESGKSEVERKNSDTLQPDLFGGSTPLKTNPTPAPVSNTNTAFNPGATEKKNNASSPSVSSQREQKGIPGFNQGNTKPLNNEVLGKNASNANDGFQFQRMKEEKEKSTPILMPASMTSPESNTNNKVTTNNVTNTPSSATPPYLASGSATPSNNTPTSVGSSTSVQQGSQSASRTNPAPTSTSSANNPINPTAEPVMPLQQSSAMPLPMGPSAAMPGPAGNDLGKAVPATPTTVTPLTNSTPSAIGNSSRGTNAPSPASQSNTSNSTSGSPQGGSVNSLNGQTPKVGETENKTTPLSQVKSSEPPLQPMSPLSTPSSAPPINPLPISSNQPSPATPLNGSSTPAPTLPTTPAPVSPVPASPAPATVTPIPQPPAPPSNLPKENSFYIRDPQPTTNPSSVAPSNDKNNPVGLMPAPLPLPTAPASPSSPTSPDKSLSSNNPPPRPQTATGPSVSSYDEQVYECQPGDTFERISEKFYMGPRYAEALKRHNQLHPRSSLTDNGALTARGKIFIPQAWVLDQNYADAIPRPSSAPTSGTVPASFNPNPSGNPTPLPQR